MRPTITSLQNTRVKKAVTLRRRRAREQQGCCLIDGQRELRRAMQASVDLVDLFVCHEFCQSEESRQLLDRVVKAGVSVTPVTPTVFSKLAFGERQEAFVAVAQRTLRSSLNHLSLDADADPLLVVLEGVEKPGNLGAVIRTADGAGAAAVIVADGTTDLYNPNAIRASLGGVFSLPVCQASGEETLRWLRAQGLQIIAARVDAAQCYTIISFRRPTAIVLGSEAHGLSELWRADDVRAVRLPMCGSVDSLNLSATAAVLLYEGRRQSSLPAKSQ